MQFNIKGIHCDSCTTLISMDLEDIGIADFQLEKDSGLLKIDDKYKNQKNEIIQAVSTSGEYIATEIAN